MPKQIRNASKPRRELPQQADLELPSRLNYQGENLVESPLSLKTTGRDIIEEAQLLGLPTDDYAVFVKHEEDYLHLPPDRTIEEIFEEEGIDITESTFLEVEIATELKGA